MNDVLLDGVELLVRNWELACLFGLALLLLWLLGQIKRPYTYVRRKDLITARELAALAILEARYPRVWSKVRLADLVMPEPYVQAAFNAISSKHIDFVIVADDGAAIAAIELQDRTHNTATAKQRDAIKRAALKSAGIPLYEVWRLDDLRCLRIQATR